MSGNYCGSLFVIKNSIITAVFAIGTLSFFPTASHAYEIIPQGKCAFTVASRQTFPEVQSYIDNSLHSSHRSYLRVVLTKNGWYAITVGDVAKEDFEDIKRRLVSRGEVPSDSYCSNGSSYIRVVSSSEYKSGAPTPRNQSQQVSVSNTRYIYVPGSRTILHENPNNSSSTVSILRHGAPVTFLESNGSWTKVNSNGSVGWISSTFLVKSKSELNPPSNSNDYTAEAMALGAAAGAALIACSLGGIVGVDCFGSKKASSSKITIKNSCSRDDVRIAVRYLDTDDRWRTRGWWTFEYGERANLVSNDDTLWTNNAIVYYYAETLDGDIVWKGDQLVEFGDDDLYMAEHRTTSDTININLSCDN